MLTKEQVNILGVFFKNIFAELTFKQIKEQSKQKSNNVVQIALKEFLKEKLIFAKVTGNVTTYWLDLDNNLTLAYLNLINEEELVRKRFPKDILKEIKKRLFKQTEFFILIIFGSYAKNKANDQSDLDLAIIVESEQTKKEIAPLLETVKRREVKPIDYHLFTRDEFLEMLNGDSENVGKQIYKSNLIYCGFIEYYHLIKRKKNE